MTQTKDTFGDLCIYEHDGLGKCSAPAERNVHACTCAVTHPGEAAYACHPFQPRGRQTQATFDAVTFLRDLADYYEGGQSAIFDLDEDEIASKSRCAADEIERLRKIEEYARVYIVCTEERIDASEAIKTGDLSLAHRQLREVLYGRPADQTQTSFVERTRSYPVGADCFICRDSVTPKDAGRGSGIVVWARAHIRENPTHRVQIVHEKLTTLEAAR